MQHDLAAQLATEELKSLLTEPDHDTREALESELFLVIARDGMIRRAGVIAEHLLGYPAEALGGTNAFSFFHADDAPQLLGILVEALTQAESSRAIEVRLRRGGSVWRSITLSASGRLDDPVIQGIALELRGPDASVRAADQAMWTAMHDPVTNLPNRGLFIDRLEHALARGARRNLPAVVMVVGFNEYVQAGGAIRYDVGDAFIVAVAQRLRSCLRTSDTIARLGYDELGLLLEEIADPAGIAIVADRILQSMAVPFFDGANEILLTPDIGVAVGIGAEQRAVDLIRDAGIARAWARIEGSGRYVMFDPAMTLPEDGQEREQLETPRPASVPPCSSTSASPVEDQLAFLQERLATLEQSIARMERASSGDE